MEEASILQLKAIFPVSISCWIEVESSQTLQVYLSSNLSHFTTNTRSGRRNWNTAEVADRWWGQKGELKEPGKRLGMKDKWEERARTNFKNWTCRGSMCILEEGIVISRLARIKQDRGRTDWRAEAEDRKKRRVEPPCSENYLPAPGEVLKYVLNMKLSSCYWGKRWLVLDKEHCGKGSS